QRAGKHEIPRQSVKVPQRHLAQCRHRRRLEITEQRRPGEEKKRQQFGDEEKKNKKNPSAKPSLPSELNKFWTISASGDHGVTGREAQHLEVPPAQQQRQDDKQAAHRSSDAVIWQLPEGMDFVENESRERKNLV